MGQGKERRAVKQHRLLIYEGIGSRLRAVPFMLAGLSVILFGLGWLSTQDFVQGGDTSLLQVIWQNKVYLIVILFVSGAVYAYGFVTGKMSYVEAGPRTLRIQAGLLALNISYKRITQIRLSQVGVQYPEDTLRGADADLLDPLLNMTCTLVDLRSWPWPGYGWLKRFWGKFMFSGDTGSLMLVVRDAMVLNQQIDSRITVKESKTNAYVDPFTRAQQQQKKSGRR